MYTVTVPLGQGKGSWWIAWMLPQGCWETWLRNQPPLFLIPFDFPSGCLCLGHPTTGNHCHEWVFNSLFVFALLAQKSESLSETRSRAVAQLPRVVVWCLFLASTLQIGRRVGIIHLEQNNSTGKFFIKNI